MKNAHERLGTVTFSKHTQNSSTNVSTHCDRYAINSDGYLQILSIFGNDAEVAAVHGAIMKANSLRMRFPEAKNRYASFEKDAVCYRSAIQLPNKKTKLRHIVAVSQNIIQNGSLGTVFCLSSRSDIVWNTLVHTLGLPAMPQWDQWIYQRLVNDEKITPLEGRGISMITIETTRDEMLRLIRLGVTSDDLPFPSTNKPLRFPRIPMREALEECESAFDSAALDAVSC